MVELVAGSLASWIPTTLTSHGCSSVAASLTPPAVTHPEAAEDLCITSSLTSPAPSETQHFSLQLSQPHGHLTAAGGSSSHAPTCRGFPFRAVQVDYPCSTELVHVLPPAAHPTEEFPASAAGGELQMHPANGSGSLSPIYHHSSPSWDLNTSPALALSL